ncbi:MAG: hydroxymethylbilane synthase [Eubacterium sp.]|nr:hydroxymethylbilane synthase [Eubacterium sp.]
METRRIRIGTRQSRLALAQAELLKQSMLQSCPHLNVSLIPYKTTGDRILDRSLDEIGGKGLFVRELDEALAKGLTDLSVHSLKDLPVEEDPDYPILGYSRREMPQDALVLPPGASKVLPRARIGTSSPRRSLQLAALYSDCDICPVRGNVFTRLQKLDRGEYDALVLAAAGLRRLHLEHRISRIFSVEEMIPAAGQGILAVQGRKDFDMRLLRDFVDADSAWQALAERGFVRALGGGCASPAAAHAQLLSGGELLLTGMTQDSRGGMVIGAARAPKQDADKLGRQLAEKLGGQGQ